MLLARRVYTFYKIASLAFVWCHFISHQNGTYAAGMFVSVSMSMCAMCMWIAHLIWFSSTVLLLLLYQLFYVCCFLVIVETLGESNIKRMKCAFSWYFLMLLLCYRTTNSKRRRKSKNTNQDMTSNLHQLEEWRLLLITEVEVGRCHVMHAINCVCVCASACILYMRFMCRHFCTHRKRSRRREEREKTRHNDVKMRWLNVKWHTTEGRKLENYIYVGSSKWNADTGKQGEQIVNANGVCG